MPRQVNIRLVIVLAIVIGTLAAGAMYASTALYASTVPAAAPYTLFESSQVRPLALAPTKNLLFAVNTPDNRLEMFSRDPTGALAHNGSVMVGMEPVAVAARNDNEVWVVNQLSDSVSIVDVSNPKTARVVHTLLVGDEPRDIVFGGPSKNLAFITAAHRGQNAPFDPQFTTPGIGRADVWVFDANNLSTSLGGTPKTIITLFGDTPRALTVTPDGSKVYAAILNSGNRTTIVAEGLVPAGALPPPNTNYQLIPQPAAGLIVQYNGTHWVDTLNRIWDKAIRLSLPDKDVFVIDATANPPAPVSGSAGFYSGVGTTLFNMAVNPVNGNVYVTNTEALNQNRLTGPGTFGNVTTLRGHFVEQHITVLSGTQVLPRHLNKHINYAVCCAPSPNPESVKSLALPQGMAVTADGSTLYMAAFGSSKIGIFKTAEIENDTFVPNTANQITVSGGGPSGVVLDEKVGILYAMTRFSNSISVINTAAKQETSTVTMYSPEPSAIVNNRHFLYDALHSSSHGDSTCASCHVSGDLDGLAWDLGNADAAVVNNLNPMVGNKTVSATFHPLKGPMTTQSLRGMINSGPMHWRGDKTGASPTTPNVQPSSGAYDEVAAFKQFAGAFPDLMGRSAPLSDADMQSFSDFVLKITYPPNPVRALDNSLTADQAAGHAKYFDTTTPIGCNNCHVLDPLGNSQFGVPVPGFFGTDGRSGSNEQPQIMKVPQLRNAYAKVGMFGIAATAGNYQSSLGYGFMGDQIKGFGFANDGRTDSIFRFLAGTFFNQSPTNPGGIPLTPAGDTLRRQLESFVLAYDSNLAPIVGQQITLGSTSSSAVLTRLDLFKSRAALGECDLVVKLDDGTREKGFLYNNSGSYQADIKTAPLVTDAQLRAYAIQPGHEATFTCVPPGSGNRMALDRDMDTWYDGDEIIAGTNPADPKSHP